MMVSPTSIQRLSVVIRGAVQGVGFRPFVYRLATELDLDGWVANTSRGVFIEVEGEPDRLERFLLRVRSDPPPRSFIHSLEHRTLDAVGYEGFEIRRSDPVGEKTAVVLPDIATCSDCLAEILDPNNRRYRYPFTNCTNCGPRFSIIESLPYDRPHTTMRGFEMCDRCLQEYDDPLDRRFHAQPNACPECGPRLQSWDRFGTALGQDHDALLQAVAALQGGAVVGLKGLGGYQLLVDARNESAVRTLRERKLREQKPLAMMFPSLDAVERSCSITAEERQLLIGPESPIVLLKKRSGADGIAPSVAPDNPYLGAMLPYTPLHHLLMTEIEIPLVATSGNLSDEPICIDETEALERLAAIVDLFVVHDRPITRQVDDSVTRVVAGRPQVLRRARGYAPLPVLMGPGREMPPMVAVGAHLKNSVALSLGRQVFVSQHIGDLDNEPAYRAFRRVVDDLRNLWEIEPVAVVCDDHPDYVSSRHAADSGLAVLRCQHHYAHALSCMAENEVAPPALAVSWDGTGLGTDGAIWGGEFLRVDSRSFSRVAHLRPFTLPGGEVAIKEPWRMAAGVLFEIFGNDLFEERGSVFSEICSDREWELLRTVLQRKINAPVTTSAGRLFDAVSAIVAPRKRIDYEGQAAMELEFMLEQGEAGVYPLHLDSSEDGALVADWESMVRAILDDRMTVSPERISARFHNTLVELVVAVSRRVGEPKVVLTGGCFQNRYLTERCVERLREEEFQVYWHQLVPPNDGGIALGQLVSAALRIEDGNHVSGRSG